MHYQKQLLRRDCTNLKAIVGCKLIGRGWTSREGKKIGRERSGTRKSGEKETDELSSWGDRWGCFIESRRISRRRRRWTETRTCVRVYERTERERGESKGRARSGWMHSGYFWIDPDIRRPCFLGPCFKLFRIINELNRIRACRLPALSSIPPRTKTSFTSKFTTPGYLALPTYLPIRATKSKRKRRGKEEGGKKHPRYAHKPIYSATLELNGEWQSGCKQNWTVSPSILDTVGTLLYREISRHWDLKGGVHARHDGTCYNAVKLGLPDDFLRLNQLTQKSAEQGRTNYSTVSRSPVQINFNYTKLKRKQ